MIKWQQFLNSLGTPGGNLFLLVTFVMLLLALVLHLLHSSTANDQVTTVILTTFSGFSGALLQAFKGRSSDVPLAAVTGAAVTSSTETHVESKS